MLIQRNNQRLLTGIILLFVILFTGCTLEEQEQMKVEEGKFLSSTVSFKENEGKIDSFENVINYCYVTSQEAIKNQYLLKNLDFDFYEELKIPGMPDTKEEDAKNQIIYSEAQCPQGLCFAEDYVLLTSYSTDEECLGALLVFQRDTGEYLLTLGLDPDSHLGGITYDGSNVWICNSNEKYIERISYDFIELMAEENKGAVIDATDVVDIYPVKNMPSCVTFYSGRLWVATHNKYTDSKMVAYYYNRERDALEMLSVYKIPARVQGVAFDEEGRVFFSSSYGRKNSSYLWVYDSVISYGRKNSNPLASIEMPPNSEEIELYDGKVYVLFESAGELYYEGTDGYGKSLSPIDKILTISINSFLEE